MCGVAGLISAEPIEEGLLRRMADVIAHRGPDDSGTWLSQDRQVGLGHRRLSIVDLSPLGHQPMASADGRFVIAFNGEIYNHAELRAELNADGSGPEWRGHSDTETLVEATARWGLRQALEKSVGMFALAVWDRQERRLHLARDRFGEKPLYFGWVGSDFVFASELKSLRAHPRFDNEVDRRALRLYASRGYVPAPLSIYRHIYKLAPGTVLAAGLNVAAQRPSGPPIPGEAMSGLVLQRYWSYREVQQQGLASQIPSEAEALERLEQAMAAAIGGQSIADVPVGAFLSGGIDSSLVVGLYQKYSSRKVRTFTIGFEEEAFNEAHHAKAVAAHFGTEHHERYVTFREAQEVIPLLPAMYDEPFADSSQIPTHIVSRFAREQVKVALSGDGGDELFGGYNRYFGSARLWSGMKRLPRPLRMAVGRSLGQVPPSAWDGMAGLLPQGRRPPYFGSKVQKTLRTMGAADGLEDVFATFLDEWSGGASPVIGAEEAVPACDFDLDIGGDAPEAVRMMYCDALSYLPDDILCKVDRASMAVSLETRAPFLDHRVAELAARIPVGMKIGGGKGKLILRKLLYRQAPAALFERPKAGFGIPVGEWIKGPLRDWAEALLDEHRLAREGYFDPAMVRFRWEQHLRGQRDSTPALWAILMFQAWLDEQGSGADSLQGPALVAAG